MAEPVERERGEGGTEGTEHSLPDPLSCVFNCGFYFFTVEYR